MAVGLEYLRTRRQNNLTDRNSWANLQNSKSVFSFLHGCKHDPARIAADRCAHWRIKDFLEGATLGTRASEASEQ